LFNIKQLTKGNNMNNLKKIGLTALGTALVATTGHAADFSVSGSTAITYVSQSGNVKSKWSQGDSITFTTSGEMDNGMSVTYKYEIDDGATGAKMVTVSNDLGSLQFAGMDNSGPISAWDDLTPTANEEAHGTGVGGVGTVDGAANGQGSDDVFILNMNLMDGMDLLASYAPSLGTTRVEGSMEYGIKYTGIDGLALYAAMGENKNAANEADNTNLAAVYTMGAMSVGIQANSTDFGTGTADEDFSAIGLSYAVSDDLSVSVNSSTISYEDADKEDQEAAGVSFSYTSGGLTVSGSTSSINNVAGTPTNDDDGFELNFKFAY
jgi:outer membrane protein OmpU